MIIPLGISGGSHDRDTCDWDGDTMIAPTGPGTMEEKKFYNCILTNLFFNNTIFMCLYSDRVTVWSHISHLIHYSHFDGVVSVWHQSSKYYLSCVCDYSFICSILDSERC